MQSRRGSKHAKLLTATFLLGATGLLAAAGLYWYQGAAFDRVAWTDEVRVRDGVRLKMADRLVARRALLKKGRPEVLALLGKPTDTECFRDWDLVYWLGPERSWMRIDSEWLALRFGADQEVTDVKIVRD